jgi:ketosteroid isomerase-like protein
VRYRLCAADLLSDTRFVSVRNVDLVRSVIDAHERGDYEAVFAAYDPEIEWDVTGTQVPVSDVKTISHGHDGIRAFWRHWFETWEAVTFEYEEFIDAGDDVVGVLTQRMRGRASGLDVEWKSYAQVWTVRNEKIVRVRFFSSREDALAALVD